MSDNVIILGAGASAAAGIPMLGGFMDTMWTLARSKRLGDIKLTNEDLEVLNRALSVREELDGYHGRAAFNVWNIEDILSILSFSSTESLEAMTRAIARVIELTCSIKHDGQLDRQPEQSTVYMQFWRALLNWSRKRGVPVPPILTFNYDLVLERSLLHAIAGTHFRGHEQFGYHGIEIAYSTSAIENPAFQCDTAIWYTKNGTAQEPGMALKDAKKGIFGGTSVLTIDLLKLHGSLNFPRPQHANRESEQTSSERLTKALCDPLILPPVFNKATDAIGKDVWTQALAKLRHCKNLIICGYSLPATDIYMQYFLKAALGPNQDLNKIYVFDPVLFQQESRDKGDALKARYARNFSEPIQQRIEFNPNTPGNWGSGAVAKSRGTMHHLVGLLDSCPDELLFS